MNLPVTKGVPAEMSFGAGLDTGLDTGLDAGFAAMLAGAAVETEGWGASKAPAVAPERAYGASRVERDFGI
jgi:hypothetical protein